MNTKCFRCILYAFTFCRGNKFTVGDVFIGYDKDTAASIVLQVTRDTDEETGAIEVGVLMLKWRFKK